MWLGQYTWESYLKEERSGRKWKRLEELYFFGLKRGRPLVQTWHRNFHNLTLTRIRTDGSTKRLPKEEGHEALRALLRQRSVYTVDLLFFLSTSTSTSSPTPSSHLHPSSNLFLAHIHSTNSNFSSSSTSSPSIILLPLYSIVLTVVSRKSF